MDIDNTMILKVSGNTITSKLVDAAIGYIKSGKTVILDAVGASSTYIATKAMIRINGKLSERKMKAVFVPSYNDTQNPEGFRRTFISWEVIAQQ